LNPSFNPAHGDARLFAQDGGGDIAPPQGQEDAAHSVAPAASAPAPAAPPNQQTLQQLLAAALSQAASSGAGSLGERLSICRQG
jgi:hypothetical protein